jgi:site-specific recombinase XerD
VRETLTEGLRDYPTRRPLPLRVSVIVSTHDYVDIDRLMATSLATHRKKTTIDSYRQHLSGFRRWCDDRNLHVLDVNQLDLKRYFAGLTETLAPATVRTRQGGLASFYAYVVTMGVPEESPMAAIKRARGQRRPQPSGLTREDFLQLLAASETIADREARLLLLFLLGGLRTNEVVDLNVDDLEFTLAGVKTNPRTRTVGTVATFPPTVARRLKDVVGDHRAGPVFRTDSGTRMDGQAVRRSINRVRAHIKFRDPIRPQALRTLMTETALSAGLSTTAVAEAIGVEDLRAFTILLPTARPKGEHPSFKLVRLRSDAQTVEDVLLQARVLMQEPGVHPLAPIVVAGAALESRLRALVAQHGLHISGQPGMSKYIEALKADGRISKSEWRQLQVPVDLRNQAAHGEDLGNLTETDATKMVDESMAFVKKYH